MLGPTKFLIFPWGRRSSEELCGKGVCASVFYSRVSFCTPTRKNFLAHLVPKKLSILIISYIALLYINQKYLWGNNTPQSPKVLTHKTTHPSAPKAPKNFRKYSFLEILFLENSMKSENGSFLGGKFQ